MSISEKHICIEVDGDDEEEAVPQHPKVELPDLDEDEEEEDEAPALRNRMVTLFSGVETEPAKNIPIERLVRFIRGGGKIGLLRRKVEEIRGVAADPAVDDGKKKRQKRLKEKLPSVTLSGTMSTRDRGTTWEERDHVHSGLIQVDVDDKDLNGKTLEEAAEILQGLPFILFTAQSPSGNGIKAVAVVPIAKGEEEHKAAFAAVESALAEVGLGIDPVPSNSKSACFVTYDPEIWTNWGAVTIDVPEGSVREDESEEFIGANEPEEELLGLVPHESVERVKDALGHIDPDVDYGDWTRVLCGIKHEFQGGDEQGFELFDEWSSEGSKYDGKATIRKKWNSFKAASPTGNSITIGTVFNLAKKNGWNPAFELVQPNPDLPEDTQAPSIHSAFPITRADEIEESDEMLDFVEGLLTEGGASVVYGPSNCGKSFWVLSLAAAIASGAPFRDSMEVSRGAVVYVALEGTQGVRNRIRVLSDSGGFPDDSPLFLCFAPVSLLDKHHTEKLAATLELAAQRSSLPCRLVILDTLARAMAGGDENSGRDMGESVRAMDAIRQKTGAHVLLVHHCGKDEARGARGHSSLRAAVDTEIEVSRPEGDEISTVRVTKQRDLERCGPMPFSLSAVRIGTDRRGKPITSCVVQHEAEDKASSPSRAGRKAKCTPEDMLVYLPANTVKEWMERVAEETGLSKSQFYEHKKILQSSGLFVRTAKTGAIVPTAPLNALPDLDDGADSKELGSE